MEPGKKPYTISSPSPASEDIFDGYNWAVNCNIYQFVTSLAQFQANGYASILIVTSNTVRTKNATQIFQLDGVGKNKMESTERKAQQRIEKCDVRWLFSLKTNWQFLYTKTPSVVFINLLFICKPKSQSIIHIYTYKKNSGKYAQTTHKYKRERVETDFKSSAHDLWTYFKNDWRIIKRNNVYYIFLLFSFDFLIISTIDVWHSLVSG